MPLPTPNTDAIVYTRTVNRDGMDYDVEIVDADFARNLETHLKRLIFVIEHRAAFSAAQVQEIVQNARKVVPK